ncbi:hypothetical protein EJB05_33421, partial [Eragrostis curvula]
LARRKAPLPSRPMEGAVVSASKGVMDSVLAKLNDLVWDTGANLIGVSRDILFLMYELPAMNALLEKLEGNEQLDPQVKNWRNQVLEMTYNIEDCIDDFKNNMTSFDAKANLISKVYNFIMTLRARFETAMRIKELRFQLQEISDRCKRYKVDCTPSATIEPFDARLPALYNDATSLVGIDNPKEDFIEWILDGDQSLKVVSIVGTGGLGKTTLANEVYREVGGHFICKAFVSVSSNPDLTRILTSMLSQLKPKDPIIQTACDVQSILDNLIQYVRDKRYLIIIDDLWGVPPWNTIRCAFPENNRQSRVIVTTRDAEVARACCSDHQYIHDMQPLSDTNSRALFLKRISISEDDSRFQNSETVLCQILKKCGGLPLAIITIASILACQQSQSGTLKQQWEFIQNCLAVQSAANPTLQDMVHILDLSYKSLPHHLKSCFLYLGKYPEDYMIRKDDLVRQWVAEGFVMISPGRDAWDIAEGYFYGLVNRSMIQPICDRFDNTMVYACRVHDMMLDLILRRCREDNFITVVHDPQKVAEAQYKVRRLSINMSGAEHATMTVATTCLLSQVRSLSKFGGLDWMPPLLEFRFIRVLLLESNYLIRETELVESFDLTCIIQLSYLRYLKIKLGYGSNIELPSQIQRLQYLETLELPDWLDFCLPSDIVDLPRLSHLIVTMHARLPDGIGKLNQLRTLQGFSLQKSSSENIKALGALTNLVDLTLYHSEEGNSEPMLTKICALSSALEKLSYLKRICISAVHGRRYYPGDGLSSLSPPFRNLESLYTYHVTFCRVPRWIGDLRNLRSLALGLDEISNSSWKEDVGIIGTLPSLVFLSLQIGGVTAERIELSRTMGFAALKAFSFDCDGMSRLSFEARTMPNLQMVSLYFDPHGWDKVAPAGLEHLPSLKEIEACKVGPDDGLDLLIRDVFQEFVGALPSRPAFTFRENEWRPRPASMHNDAS